MFVKNHMSKPLILQAKSGMVGLMMNAKVAASLGRVVIPPGQGREVPFWDSIKNHPYYTKKLDDGKITTKSDGEHRGIEHDFSSFGDTLEMPSNLENNDGPMEGIEVERNIKALNAAGPNMSPPAKRRGRPAKVQTETKVNEVADLVSDIGE